MLTERELERYDRQIMIFGEEGQEKLKGAKSQSSVLAASAVPSRITWPPLE